MTRYKDMPLRYRRVPFMPSRLIGPTQIMNSVNMQGVATIKILPGATGFTPPIVAPALRTVYPGMPWLPVGN